MYKYIKNLFKCTFPPFIQTLQDKNKFSISLSVGLPTQIKVNSYLSPREVKQSTLLTKDFQTKAAPKHAESGISAEAMLLTTGTRLAISARTRWAMHVCSGSHSHCLKADNVLQNNYIHCRENTWSVPLD